MLYFAYGSNMSTRRLQRRIPSARPIGCGELAGHRLAFHKVGRDGSGKCDACAGHGVLHGVVYEMSATELPLLDACEGLGRGYAHAHIHVRLAGQRVEALMYVATRIDERLRPLCWYREHVLRGALEHRLPAPHIDTIRRVSVLPDTNLERRRDELSIYGSDRIPVTAASNDGRS